MVSKKYKIVKTHYGKDVAIWRVVSLEENNQVKTLKKCFTKTEAKQYLAHLTQSTDERHNQW